MEISNFFDLHPFHTSENCFHQPLSYTEKFSLEMKTFAEWTKCHVYTVVLQSDWYCQIKALTTIPAIVTRFCLLPFLRREPGNKANGF